MGGVGRRIRQLLGCCLAALTLTLVTGTAATGQAATVATTEVRGTITPVVAEHLADAVETAARDGHAALVIHLDTPGGLVTSMREIVQTFLGAPVPVIVYVGPRGADAGSAGTFITLAAHVAAMAPATTIGAATPVDLEGGEVGEKIVNNAAAHAEAIARERGRDVTFAVDAVRDGRSVTADEALEVGAIDLIAEDLGELLTGVDGAEVDVRGDAVTLATAGATTVEIDWSLGRRLLQLLADPNLAFLFISIGTLAIVYEVANPGLGAGGMLGAVLLILAMFSLSVIPVTLAGALLLVLAAALFVAELFLPGTGVGAVGGTAALVLGGLFLVDDPGGVTIDLWVLLPTGAVMLGMTALAGVLVQRSRRRGPSMGVSEFQGRRVVVRLARDGTPRAQVDGVWWRLRPDAPDTVLTDGHELTVVDRDNLDLIVSDPARGPAAEPTDPPTEVPPP